MADTQPVGEQQQPTFSSFSNILDTRILRALADVGFARPTLVQSKAIPLALEGRDILARARTGSGKTIAYCVPVVQKILSAKNVSDGRRYDLVATQIGFPTVLGIRRSFCAMHTRIDISSNQGAGRTGLLAFATFTVVLR
jgi:superfamily II DNA/RNA helicase